MEIPEKSRSSHKLVCLPHAGGSAHVYNTIQQCLAPTPLPVPINAIYGKADPSIPSGSMDAWAAYSRADFCRVCFEGGHFHLFENPEPVCRHIAKTLGAA